MTEIPKNTEISQTPERPVLEGDIQDLGIIALETLRIQYPQPKQHFIKLRNTPVQVRRSTTEFIERLKDL